MEQLAPQLVAAVPRLSVTGREIIALLANSGGRIRLTSRHQLARVLTHEGLPQIEELCAWVKALRLLLEWEHTHRSLYSLALDAALYPPNCYRLVKRVTGKTWRQACADGFAFLLVSFVNRCSTLRHGRQVAERTAVERTA